MYWDLSKYIGFDENYRRVKDILQQYVSVFKVAHTP